MIGCYPSLCYSSLYSLSQPCDRLLDVTLLLLWFVIPGSHLYIEDPALASFLGTSFLAAFLSWLPQQISPLSKTLFTHGPCLHEILMRQEPRFPSSSGYKRKLDTEAAAGYWTRAFQHGKQVSQSWCWTLCYHHHLHHDSRSWNKVVNCPLGSQKHQPYPGIWRKEMQKPKLWAYHCDPQYSAIMQQAGNSGLLILSLLNISKLFILLKSVGNKSPIFWNVEEIGKIPDIWWMDIWWIFCSLPSPSSKSTHP